MTTAARFASQAMSAARSLPHRLATSPAIRSRPGSITGAAQEDKTKPGSLGRAITVLIAAGAGMLTQAVKQAHAIPVKAA